MLFLYGGVGADGETRSDLHNLRINLDTLQATSIERQANYEEVGAQFYMRRQGFTMHIVPQLPRPAIIGGGYGNSQKGNSFVMLPDRFCSSQSELQSLQCLPCPRGSEII